MQNYTLIVGSAYGDDCPDIYVILAPDPRSAHDYVLSLDQSVKSMKRSVLFIMDGEVSFQPSTYATRPDEMEFAAPTKIDLRPGWTVEPVRATPFEQVRDAFGLGGKRKGSRTGRAAGPPLPEGMSHGGAQAARDTLREQAPGIADVRDSIAAHDASRAARKPRGKTPLEIASAAVDPEHKIVTRSPRKARAKSPVAEALPAPPAATEAPLVSAGGQRVLRAKKAGRTSLITGKERATRKPSTGSKGS